MKHAYSSKEIGEAIQWMQELHNIVSSKEYRGSFAVAIDLMDNALEDAIAREKWERENEPKPQKLGDIWWGKCLDGTGFQPPEFEEDKRTAGLVTDVMGEK